MEYTEKELEHERWKPIFGYDGMYEVSDLGRVRSSKSGELKLMRASKDKGGYSIVCLYRDGKRKPFLVHRLVASAFIPNYNIFNTDINHINECKSDNRVENLEWCTALYNSNYNDVQFRKKNSKRRKIEKLYRPELSYKDNFKIFNANGVECSEQTLWRLRKDLGLNKNKSNQ